MSDSKKEQKSPTLQIKKMAEAFKNERLSPKKLVNRTTRT